MIINTGQRTDIPAFYAPWLEERLREGVVCVRNPFDHHQVSRYRLDSSVVDVIGFCTKNPEPMLPLLPLLKPYGQFWYVTITPYGRDIEPRVPDKHHLLEVFCELSARVGGPGRIGWRYDPIFLSERYTREYHLHAFSQMAAALEGATDLVVISFIDLYEKVRRNFPEVREVPRQEQLQLTAQLVQIAARHGMRLFTCAEGDFLAQAGAETGGCMTIPMYERAIGQRLIVPHRKTARAACACYLACDIGAYDSCLHLCRYCYANNDRRRVLENHRRHDVHSPFLIGGFEEGDRIHDVPQESWIDRQLSLW